MYFTFKDGCENGTTIYFNQSSGIIQYPNFSPMYPANDRCNWAVKIPTSNDVWNLS